MAAVTAALLARQRARRQAGMVGLALRLGSDPVLRGQLAEGSANAAAQGAVPRRAEAQPQAAQLAVRARRVRRRLRGGRCAGGARAGAELVKKGKGSVGSGFGAATGFGGSTPATVSEEIEVEVPVSTAYNQWTQFEQFPRSWMASTASPSSTTRCCTGWRPSAAAKPSGTRRSWSRSPTGRSAWVSTDGKDTRGTVTFTCCSGASRTILRVELELHAGRPARAGGVGGRDRPAACPRRPRAVQAADRVAGRRGRSLARRDPRRRQDLVATGRKRGRRPLVGRLPRRVLGPSFLGRRRAARPSAARRRRSARCLFVLATLSTSGPWRSRRRR